MWRRASADLSLVHPASFSAPGVLETFQGFRPDLQIVSASPLPARGVTGVGGATGEVIEVDRGGFTVVCADGRLRGDDREGGRRKVRCR